MSAINVAARIAGAGHVVQALEGAIDAAEEAEWVVGTNVEYSVYVEFGTSRQAAQPYLRPAVESAQRKSERIFSQADSLDDAIRDLAFFIEKDAKRRCPVDTGNLMGSIRAEKL